MAARKQTPARKAAATRRPSVEANAAIAKLEAWADAGSTAALDEVLHETVGGYLLACARRPATQLDPFEISLA